MKNYTKNKKKIIILGNTSKSLINFRLQLINSLNDKFVPIVVLPQKDERAIKILKILNIKHYIIDTNSILIKIFKLYSIFKTNDIKYTLSYNLKSVLITYLFSKIFKIKKNCIIITGLGRFFSYDTYNYVLIQKILLITYKLILSNSKLIIFQNYQDKELLIQKNTNIKNVIVNGSGVDQKKYKFSNKFPARLTFVFASRVLKEKGILNFLECAKYFYNKKVDITFNVIGSIENKIIKNLISKYSLKKIINYYGHKENIIKFIENSSVIVLPSYYREGIPRILIEAASVGRPIITCDTVGCREVVRNNINGFKIPKNNSYELINKVQWFIDNSHKIIDMGLESKKLCEEKFNVNKVNEIILKNLYKI